MRSRLETCCDASRRDLASKADKKLKRGSQRGAQMVRDKSGGLIELLDKSGFYNVTYNTPNRQLSSATELGTVFL